MVRELGVLYEAFARGEGDPLAPLAVQYADYAAGSGGGCRAMRSRMQRVAYWREALAGSPALLELPWDRRRPAQQDFTWRRVLGSSSTRGLTAGLRSLGQRHGLTLFMTVLSGWALVLSRLSGQDDIVVGTPSANRTRSEIEGLIGFFVNTLALRIDLSGAPGVVEVLERVRSVVLGAQAHQDLPFEQVVDLARPERSLGHTPLFQAMFAWQNNEALRFDLDGLSAEGIEGGRKVAKYDLTLDLQRRGVGSSATLFMRRLCSTGRRPSGSLGICSVRWRRWWRRRSSSLVGGASVVGGARACPGGVERNRGVLSVGYVSLAVRGAGCAGLGCGCGCAEGRRWTTGS